MSLGRSLDRWTNLRDEINSLFEGPYWGTPMNHAQLFSGWSPALDLYQSNDEIVALVELPGMRKEDIELALQDGILTISGERKEESAREDNTARTERFVGKIPPEHLVTHSRGCREGERHLQGRNPDRDAPKS